MFDIIRAKGVSPAPFLFSNFFILDEVKGKIISVADLEEAAKSKSKKALVIPQDYRSDIGLMKGFAGGKAAYLVDLGRIIESSGFRRSMEMAKIRNFLRICVKYEVPFAIASFAGSEFSIRNAQELCNICALVGLNAGQARFASERLGEYLA